ncbi:hypothetical protein JHK82_036093 [Glycine max]|nr:hypothetical protein JHK82_036093 [Glycine max]
MSLNDGNDSKLNPSSLLNSFTKLLWGQSLPPPGAPRRHRPHRLEFHVAPTPPAATPLRGPGVPVGPPHPHNAHAEGVRRRRARLGCFAGPRRVVEVQTGRTLKQIYRLRRGGYDGRSTVPMLWDKASKDVVCNESYDIIHLFNSELNSVAQNPGLDLSPPQLKKRIGEWNQIIYPNSKRQQRGLYVSEELTIENSNKNFIKLVEKMSQEGYDKALNDLFSTLDKLEVHLANSGYLCGDTLTLVDICLFTTLVRFDLAYNVLLNCTKKKLCEYTNLHAYLPDIYQIPKVAATCNFTDIMDGYYKILFPLNPGSIRPVMPSTCEHESLCRPHARESLSSATLAFVK